MNAGCKKDFPSRAKLSRTDSIGDSQCQVYETSARLMPQQLHIAWSTAMDVFGAKMCWMQAFSVLSDLGLRAPNSS